ncbi:MAG: DUF2461 domain-containing protein [Kofleriaceae bacterium]
MPRAAGSASSGSARRSSTARPTSATAKAARRASGKAKGAGAAEATPAFAGFARTAPAFFHELAVEMNRDWYQANKARYEREWVQPMNALLTEVGRALVPAYRGLALMPAKVMRLHRDVRFSKDKTPYKTHIGAVVRVGEAELVRGGAAAVYVHLGVDEEFVGAGIYVFEPDQLARWRRAVVDKAGGELAKVIERLRAAGYRVGGHDDFKRVPRGLPPDHPRADLPRMRGLTVTAPAIPRGLLHQPALAGWLTGHGQAMAPLVAWLVRHVG